MSYKQLQHAVWITLLIFSLQSCALLEKDTVDARHKIVVSYETAQTTTGDAIFQIVKEGKDLEVLSDALSSRIRMPQDLPVVFKDLKVYNAYYNPQEKNITMDYWVIAYFANALYNMTPLSDEDLIEAVENISTFIALHETGHAFIDLLSLPALGNEEQAADEFATLQLLQTGQGDKALIAAITFFSMYYQNQNQQPGTNVIQYSDEHPLDIQRYYNIVSLIYGSNPAKYEFLVTQGLLPEARAKRSEYDYQEKTQRWNEALADYIR
ncbi:DUF4344 domain-containing metallopeptidase [Xanthocytophaga agilis]|uniref:DUF4344 domain-containing metallopeptidase n=1 Tax=Xanthocytophaga agilis TaxID=3048010 RepID=A0AAE3RDF1_9BACT|nr:DUF4344 domain-containing metallopeptidase [Xanthocytophaga agilis]MDJ1506374.1 DUF4344 domain-containing metallopeptidase [Xanthocytophaga agilis]